MDTNLYTYRIWAPYKALWTAWAKPVLFTHLFERESAPLELPNLNWISAVDRNTMIIVDLAGEISVKEGVALAQLGYRPVPLYNGVYAPGNSMLIDSAGIAAALFRGAKNLDSCTIRTDAPPAFLLDSNRMAAFGKAPGKYDNRWCVFPQDMPSADYLASKGIRKIIVRSKEIRSDLSHILCRYQEQGIQIFQCSQNRQSFVKSVVVTKPSQFKSLTYRFKVIAGLTRNAAGGFGATVPDPVQSNSGARYYGFG